MQVQRRDVKGPSMTTSDLQALRIERPEPGLAEVFVLGPSRGNAMGPDFWREAPDVFAALGADTTVRAIIVRGAGKTFSTGLDIAGMAPTLVPVASGGADGRATVMKLGQDMQRSFSAVAECTQPVIAAIDGWCIGAGLELAAACDFRLATTKAKFSLREVKLSMVSDLGGLQRLPFIIGEGHAREMALTGDDYTAEDACRMGLVSRVFEDAEALSNAARGLARKVADNPPLAVAATKRAMNARLAESIKASLHEALSHNSALLQTRDFQEGVMALMEGRPARFSGA